MFEQVIVVKMEKFNKNYFRNILSQGYEIKVANGNNFILTLIDGSLKYKMFVIVKE